MGGQLFSYPSLQPCWRREGAGEGANYGRQQGASWEEMSGSPPCPDVWTMRQAASAPGHFRVERGGLASSGTQTLYPRLGQIPFALPLEPPPHLCLPFPLKHFLFPALFPLLTSMLCWIEHSVRTEQVLSCWLCIPQERAEPMLPIA